jgi:hypothetical protein
MVLNTPRVYGRINVAFMDEQQQLHTRLYGFSHDMEDKENFINPVSMKLGMFPYPLFATYFGRVIEF